MDKENKRQGRQILGIQGEGEDFFFPMQIATKSDLPSINETKNRSERSKTANTSRAQEQYLTHSV